MAKLNPFKIDTKIKPAKMPKMLKEPKSKDLSIAIKLPTQRKFKLPTVKFGKI